MNFKSPYVREAKLALPKESEPMQSLHYEVTFMIVTISSVEKIGINTSLFIHRVEQQSSEVPCGPSAQHHQTQLDSTFMVCTFTATVALSVLFSVVSMLYCVDQSTVHH